MYLRAASRLIRNSWAQFGEKAVDMLAEELASLLRDSAPLYHNNRVEIEVGGKSGVGNEFDGDTGTDPAMTLANYQTDGTALHVTEGNVIFAGTLSVTGNVTLGGLTVTDLTVTNLTFTIGIGNLSGITNYNASAIQLLGHTAAGALYWYDTSAC